MSPDKVFLSFEATFDDTDNIKGFFSSRKGFPGKIHIIRYNSEKQQEIGKLIQPRESVMIGVQAVLVQHGPCDGEKLTISHRIFQIQIQRFRDGLPPLSMFFLSMFSVRGYHLPHCYMVRVISMLLENTVRSRVNMLPITKTESGPCFLGLSGYVMSFMAPRIPHPCQHNR